MGSSAPIGNLSRRGMIYASPESKIPMQEVVSDLWHPETNPGGYVSLGVAENTLMHKEISEHMAANFSIDSHSLTYGDGFAGSHRLRDTIARFVNRNFNPLKPISRSHVVVGSGCGPVIEQCGFSLCDPGDGMLLGRPYYGSFPSDLKARAGVHVVGVSFPGMDRFGLETVAAYETALQDAKAQGIAVKAFILCNPHNPLGRCYSREVLEAYMRFCQRHGLHLISDEIYALSIWDNPDAPDAPGFTSVFSIDTEGLIDPNLVHVLWGMSKDFGSNGIRLGCLISQNNDALLRAFDANAYFSCPSALTDLVTSRILADDAFVESFVKTNLERLAANYAATVQFLDRNKIPYEKGTNAGFFVWVDLFAPIREQIDAAARHEGGSEKGLRALETRLHQTMLKRRIFLASGTAFGGETPGWFRIVFAHERSYLDRGLDRVIKAVEAFAEELKSSSEKINGWTGDLVIREAKNSCSKP